MKADMYWNLYSCIYSDYVTIQKCLSPKTNKFNSRKNISLLQRNFRVNSLARRNYIAGNLQNSQVGVCFCALRNTPVDLAKVYYSFAILYIVCDNNNWDYKGLEIFITHSWMNQ